MRGPLEFAAAGPAPVRAAACTSTPMPFLLSRKAIGRRPKVFRRRSSENHHLNARVGKRFRCPSKRRPCQRSRIRRGRCLRTLTRGSVKRRLEVFHPVVDNIAGRYGQSDFRTYRTRPPRWTAGSFPYCLRTNRTPEAPSPASRRSSLNGRLPRGTGNRPGGFNQLRSISGTP